jgi:hypothetical protein
MSYGTGRPAILTCDETIKDSALFLEHNLAIEDDMRLVSTVELMTLREHCQNLVGPFDKPITEDTFAIVKDFASRFRAWYEHWDKKFAEKYPDRGVFESEISDLANPLSRGLVLSTVVGDSISRRGAVP